MMMTLPFTEKKFKSLSVKGQHKWSIKWLSGIYHGLVTNRIPPKNFDFILTSYQTLLKWQNIAPLDPYKPKYMDPMEFIELISDAIHFHRRAQGLVPRDTDLLPRVNRMDTNPATAMDGKKKTGKSQLSYGPGRHQKPFQYRLHVPHLRRRRVLIFDNRQCLRNR